MNFLGNKVFALGKWEAGINIGTSAKIHVQAAAAASTIAADSSAVFLPRTDSQDAWIFRSPLKESVVTASGFELGRPR